MESTETAGSLGYSPRSYIATATVDDIHLLSQMGSVFADLYGANLMKFDPTVFRLKMTTFMSQGVGTILCAHEDFELKGAIAGVIYENVFDGAPCASELFWYVWPGAQKGTGARLLEAFEEWAKFRKCTRVTMALMRHNEADRLDIFYAKHGYQAFETHYVKLI
jgi:GNAT superfamily N-acetyltransferase